MHQRRLPHPPASSLDTRKALGGEWKGSDESWLLSRVAQAIEAGEVPADLLSELQAEFETSREKPPEQSQADAVQDIAIELQMPVEKVEAGLAALEVQPLVVREVLIRRIAEKRLEAKRTPQRTKQSG